MSLSSAASRLDDTSPLPLYHQLYRALRERISSGAFANARFPSEHDLIAQFGVSRVTVRKALERLEGDGIIVRRPGRGTFLNPTGVDGLLSRDLNLLLSPTEYWERQGVTLSVLVLAADSAPASDEVARALDVTPGTLVLGLRRLIRSDGEPVWIETRYLPRDVAHGLAPDDFAEYSIMSLLAERRGLQVTSMEMDLLSGAASASEARRLSIPAGTPVLVSQYTSFAAARPVQTGRTVFRGDKYRFHTRIDAASGTRRSSDIRLHLITDGVASA
jgi:GntR family transcriptional regulator